MFSCLLDNKFSHLLVWFQVNDIHFYWAQNSFGYSQARNTKYLNFQCASDIFFVKSKLKCYRYLFDEHNFTYFVTVQPCIGKKLL